MVCWFLASAAVNCTEGNRVCPVSSKHGDVLMPTWEQWLDPSFPTQLQTGDLLTLLFNQKKWAGQSFE